VSDPCDQNALLPIVFYNWQRQLFENAASAPRPPEPAAPSRALEATVEALEKQVAKKDAVIAWVTEEHVKLRKRTWGALRGSGWAPPDVRDAVIDYATEWSERTEIPVGRFITWIGVHRGKFYAWKARYGKANEHIWRTPRVHYLTPEEKKSMLDFHEKHPLDRYRRLTYMLTDQDVVAVSPTTVHRVLSAAGRLDRWTRRPSTKGTGFEQPLQPRDQWHVDISYVNVAGTFYYLCSILDGCSRYLLHWDIREAMKEADVERAIERARELHPGSSPRIISGNGPQFIAADFKTYIRLTGMTHVRTAPYYTQSNGSIERFHKAIKGDAIRPALPKTPLRHAASSGATSATTTPSASTPRSPTSPRPIACRATPRHRRRA
jgi:putative transposase